MKVRLKHIVKGRELFHVYAFPRDGKGDCTSIEKLRVESRPFIPAVFMGSKRNRMELFAKFSYEREGRRIETEHSLKDKNVIPNDYNCHQLFFTRKAAERYCARINAGCYNSRERAYIRDNKLSRY